MRPQRGEEDPRTMPTFGVGTCWHALSGEREDGGKQAGVLGQNCSL